MMSKAKIINIAIAACVITFFISSCKKDYYEDSGTVSTTYDGSSLDFLKDKGYQFDSLVKIIHLAGLDDEIGKNANTFFAPGDSSINYAVNYLNSQLKSVGKDTVADLSQIKPSTWKNELSLYIFDSIRMLNDFPQLDTASIQAFHGQAYTCYDGVRIMNIGTVYDDAVYDSKTGASIKYGGYRHIVLSYLRSYSSPLVGWINADVATSNIRTSNGVIHALNYNKHIFGFDENIFAQNVMNDGIDPLQ